MFNAQMSPLCKYCYPLPSFFHTKQVTTKRLSSSFRCFLDCFRLVVVIGVGFSVATLNLLRDSSGINVIHRSLFGVAARLWEWKWSGVPSSRIVVSLLSTTFRFRFSVAFFCFIDVFWVCFDVHFVTPFRCSAGNIEPLSITESPFAFDAANRPASGKFSFCLSW